MNKTKEEAITMYKSGWWQDKAPLQICDFQLYEEKLCMPFDKFHEAIEKALERSVWTHEFADWEGLKSEYEGKRKPETNPLESADRILRKLGRVDLAENIIVVSLPDKKES
jgi:hypothetical protein